MADRRMIQSGKSGAWTTVRTQALKRFLRVPQATGYARWKPTIGFVVTLLLLVVALPLIGLAALFIKLTSRGPVLYTQRRLGQNGQIYTIYKLRSMYHNCESSSGPRWSTKGDHRVTPVGRFLRLMHLDELPQLWNVIHGEMNLVGPRPERPEFVYELERNVPYYRSRMCVRPGVTGLAQVLLPADTDLESVQTKLKYDLYYLQNCSVLLDLQIMAATFLKIFNVPYHLIRQILFLPQRRYVERAYQELVALSWTGGYLAQQPVAEPASRVLNPSRTLIPVIPLGR